MGAKLSETDREWKAFVVRYGSKAATADLEHILGRTKAEIRQLRNTGACSKESVGRSFVELFTLWNGRPPLDAEWPRPAKVASGHHNWQPPEIALLASLVGQVDAPEIARILTARLRSVTGVQSASRTVHAVKNRIRLIGLSGSDVLGGITTADAARKLGSMARVYHLIHSGALKVIRVGKRSVIPHKVWADWISKAPQVPAGYVPLSSIRIPLGVKSDKLSEFAREGYVPSAIQAKPAGAQNDKGVYGRWYITATYADKLLADRRAGRAMPWHGKALATNLKLSYALWTERRHPSSCRDCAKIWGRACAPETIDDFAARYAPLGRGAKRHLTKPWTPGLTIQEVASKCGCGAARVRLAIKGGRLAACQHGRYRYVSRTDATIWASNGCPVGDDPLRRISVEAAIKQYGFSAKELKAFIRSGALKVQIGTEGAVAGVKYLVRTQVACLREKVGFSGMQAALRLGVSLADFRAMSKGRTWRKDGRISPADLRELAGMKNTDRGYTIGDAAKVLRRSVGWVENRVADGTVKLSRPRWDGDPPTLSRRMMARLKALRGRLQQAEKPPKGWLMSGEAAMLAGVCVTTFNKWGDGEEIIRRQVAGRWHYQPSSIKKRARSYWKTVHRLRPLLPIWLSGGKPTYDRRSAAIT